MAGVERPLYWSLLLQLLSRAVSPAHRVPSSLYDAYKMTTKKQSPSRVTQEILEMADDMRRIGIMAAKTHHQIMVRLSGPEARRYTSLGRSPR